LKREVYRFLVWGVEIGLGKNTKEASEILIESG